MLPNRSVTTAKVRSVRPGDPSSTDVKALSASAVTDSPLLVRISPSAAPVLPTAGSLRAAKLPMIALPAPPSINGLVGVFARVMSALGLNPLTRAGGPAVPVPPADVYAAILWDSLVRKVLPNVPRNVSSDVTTCYFINTSSAPMKFNGFAGDSDGTGPPPGTIVNPGQEMKFNLADSITSRESFVAVFVAVGDTSGIPHPDIGVYFTRAPFTGYWDSKCWGGACRLTNERWAIFAEDPANTTITVDAKVDPARASDLLKVLAWPGSRAVIDFVPVSQELTWTEYSKLAPLDNSKGTTPTTIEISLTRTATETDNVEFSAEVSSKISDLLNVKIAAKYGHSWTKSETFSYKYTAQVAPKTAGYLMVKDPIQRVTGYFSITLGATTYRINNVVLDTPDKSRLPGYFPDVNPVPATD
jgi:hypothetical protein